MCRNMRWKYGIIMLLLVCTTVIFSGCLLKKDNTLTDNEEKLIYGEVSKIIEDTITLRVGTLTEQKQNETSSMLELSGEEREITVTDDTVIKRQGLGRTGEQNMAKPEGGNPPDVSGDGMSPEKPEGGNPPDASGDGTPPEKPEGDSMAPQQEEITFSDISEGDTISVTLDSEGNAAEISVISPDRGQQPGGAGQAGGVESYDAVTEYSEDIQLDGTHVSSTGTDENAIHVFKGAVASLKDIVVSRTSSDSKGGDNSSFYGVGAAVLTTDGTAYISNGTIETDAAGGAGIFAYGNGMVYVSDTKITTKKDTSGGIHAAGGGSLYAWDMDVTTNGESAAAIRSDRGGGTMRVDGGTYTSNGIGSPAIYSTADIAVHDADLTANGSEAICIEGRNSIRLFDSHLTGNMKENSQNDCTWNVILYQSMSGDSEEGNSIFEMNGGTLTAKNGGMFYTTNTESTITLCDVDITYARNSDFFLRCTGNNNQRGWGRSGQNGADCLFTAVKQDMEGNVIWDSISKLDVYMIEGSRLKGAVVQDESYAREGGDGYCNCYITKDSTWVVTEDSVLSKLSSEGTIIDEEGKSVTIKGSDGTTYVEGEGDLTITVDAYENRVDVSGASVVTSWSDYKEGQDGLSDKRN